MQRMAEIGIKLNVDEVRLLTYPHRGCIDYCIQRIFCMQTGKITYAFIFHSLCILSQYNHTPENVKGAISGCLTLHLLRDR